MAILCVGMEFAGLQGMSMMLRRKTVSVVLLLLLVGFSGGLFPALADLEVSASVQIHAKAEFEAPLGAHGTWVEVGSYGRCWHPVG
ncbi:MAG TPA: hypothetical protein VL361_24845, partial [Candidatus Limnocylindrales bacterium]|nr:hypothetical protein [Candidatus Limnocylindrales bacterium]